MVVYTIVTPHFILEHSERIPDAVGVTVRVRVSTILSKSGLRSIVYTALVLKRLSSTDCTKAHTATARAVWRSRGLRHGFSAERDAYTHVKNPFSINIPSDVFQSSYLLRLAFFLVVKQLALPELVVLFDVEVVI